MSREWAIAAIFAVLRDVPLRSLLFGEHGI